MKTYKIVAVLMILLFGSALAVSAETITSGEQATVLLRGVVAEKLSLTLDLETGLDTIDFATWDGTIGTANLVSNKAGGFSIKEESLNGGELVGWDLANTDAIPYLLNFISSDESSGANGILLSAPYTLSIGKTKGIQYNISITYEWETGDEDILTPDTYEDTLTFSIIQG